MIRCLPTGLCPCITACLLRGWRDYLCICQVYVLSLWKEIGDNPTCQNYTFCLILHFLLLIYGIGPLEVLGNLLFHAQPPINIILLLKAAWSPVLQCPIFSIWNFPSVSRMFKAALGFSHSFQAVYWIFLTFTSVF